MKQLLMILILAGVVKAQLPEANNHRFFDKKNVTLFSLHTAATTWDAVETHNGLIPVWKCVPSGYMRQYCGSWVRPEANPLARPFVKTTAGQIGYFSAEVAGNMAGAYLLHRTGHHKIERVLSMVNIGFSLRGASTWTYHRGLNLPSVSCVEMGTCQF